MIPRIVFNCYFQMTMTIWVESSHSDSQELNLIKGTPLDFLQSKVEITRVVKGDNESSFQLFPNDHDHLSGVQPL